jgi:acetyl esterase/lipase
MTLSRRAVLLAGGASAVLTGCGADDTPGAGASPSGAPGSQRFRYGRDPSQFADLRLPEGTPRATVVLVHGGAWLAQYDLDQMGPLVRALNTEGFATWNVEYRRLGLGGGIPPTLTDVAAAVDRLAGPGLPRTVADDVVLVGHSAGGQLGVWAASRSARTPGGPSKVRLRGVVSLAGILDLSRGAQDPQVGQIVAGFAGGGPADVPRRYAVADPTLLVPAACPVWAVAADDDQLVPLEQARGYVARDRAAGGTATLVRVPGDHNTLISPEADSYPTILDLVRRATA